MQRKTISHIIKNKLNDWLATITDVGLAKDLKDNVVVSGGSICSLFLQEEVNDYDVYIKDINVAYRTALYYTMNHLDKAYVLYGPNRGEYIKTLDLENEDHNIRKIMYENLQENQVKLYIEGRGRKTDVQDDGCGKYLATFFSANAISLTDKIQIVLRFTGSVKEIHKTFDFIHATNYFTFEEGLVTNNRALESILSKQLFYQGSLYPLTTIIRMKKFLKRNWKISAGEMLKALFQLSRLDLTDHYVLEDQLIGVDVAYFSLLIEALNDKKKQNPNFKLTSEYLNTLVDKIFSEDDDILID